MLREPGRAAWGSAYGPEVFRRVLVAAAVLVAVLSPVGAAAADPPGPVAGAAGYFVSATQGLVQVEWSATPTGGEVTGYEVTGPDGSPADEISTDEPGRVEARLIVDPTQPVSPISIRAIGPGGAGPETIVELTGPLPGPPEDLSATIGDGGVVTLTWSPPAHVPGSASGYTVWQGTGQPAGTTSLDDRSFDIAATPGVETTFEVTMNGFAGFGAPASITFEVPRGPGYWMVEEDGAIYGFGDAQDIRGIAETFIVSVATDRSGSGLWLLRDDGTVIARDRAQHHGDVDPSDLTDGESVSTIAVRPEGDGYWVFTDRGRAVAFGAARSFGDMADTRLNGPVVASAATASGLGYWMVGSDGGIFSFGDAEFAGSTGSLTLNEPVVGIAPDLDGDGYWLVAADGGIFAFEAEFRGSVPGVLAPGASLNAPVIGALAFGDGYLMVASDGGIFNFSDQDFLGSLGGQFLVSPIVGVAAFT